MGVKFTVLSYGSDLPPLILKALVQDPSVLRVALKNLSARCNLATIIVPTRRTLQELLEVDCDLSLEVTRKPSVNVRCVKLRGLLGS